MSNAILDQQYDVCMVTTRHSLRDHRVYHKEAVSLAERLGLRVLVLAIVDEEVQASEGPIAFYGVRGSQRHVLRSVLRVGRVLLQVKAKVFHIHDFEALVLLPYLKSRHCPVIYDVHEHYELMIKNVVALPEATRAPLALIVRLYERLFARMSDHLILVEDPQLEHFRGFAIPDRRMTVVRNLVSLKGFGPGAAARAFDLVYSGSCYVGRGVYELVDAVALAKQRAKPLRLLMMLIGRQDEIDKFVKRVAELDLGAEIEVRQYVAYDKVPRALSEGRVGIVLFHDSPSHRAGIPTKLMEYGAAGLPSLTNDVNAFAVDYVNRHRAGAVIHSLEPAAILDGIAAIMADYDGCAARARAAAAENSWEAEEPKLIALYERLLAGSA
jgi:glycosyltransferase involved in cell wall biosynthesis